MKNVKISDFEVDFLCNLLFCRKKQLQDLGVSNTTSVDVLIDKLKAR